MKKVIVGVAAVVVLALAAYALAPYVGAQGPGRRPWGPDVTTLVGPGSSIGASVRDLRGDEASTAKLSPPDGVMIEGVRDGTPASRAGFRAGDVVVEFDGERIRSARQFTRLVRETPPGRAVRAVVVRNGSRETLEVTPEARGAFDLEFPELSRQIERELRNLPRNFDFDFDFDFDMPQAYGRFPRRLGASVTTLTDQLAEYFGVKEGALVSSVDAESPAAQAGIKAGDVITEINGRGIRTASDVSEAVRDAGPGAMVSIRVMRDKKETTLNATLPERRRPVVAGRDRRPV